MVTMVTRKGQKWYFGHFSLNNTFSPPSRFLLAGHVQLLDFSLYWLGNAGYMLLVYIYILAPLYIQIILKEGNNGGGGKGRVERGKGGRGGGGGGGGGGGWEERKRSPDPGLNH